MTDTGGLDRYDCPMPCDWYMTAPTPDPEGLRTVMASGHIAQVLVDHLRAVHVGMR